MIGFVDLGEIIVIMVVGNLVGGALDITGDYSIITMCKTFTRNKSALFFVNLQ